MREFSLSHRSAAHLASRVDECASDDTMEEEEILEERIVSVNYV
jgi:hypothetical protein